MHRILNHYRSHLRRSRRILRRILIISRERSTNNTTDNEQKKKNGRKSLSNKQWKSSWKKTSSRWAATTNWEISELLVSYVDRKYLLLRFMTLYLIWKLIQICKLRLMRIRADSNSSTCLSHSSELNLSNWKILPLPMLKVAWSSLSTFEQTRIWEALLCRSVFYHTISSKLNWHRRYRCHRVTQQRPISNHYQSILAIRSSLLVICKRRSQWLDHIW